MGRGAKSRDPRERERPASPWHDEPHRQGGHRQGDTREKTQLRRGSSGSDDVSPIICGVGLRLFCVVLFVPRLPSKIRRSFVPIMRHARRFFIPDLFFLHVLSVLGCWLFTFFFFDTNLSVYQVYQRGLTCLVCVLRSVVVVGCSAALL